MKKIALLALAALLPLPPAGAETENPEKEPVAVSAFIPMDQQDQYQAAINHALEAFEAKDYDQALTAIDQAKAIFPRDPFAVNLRGAVLTKTKDYQGAREAFENALALDPTFFPARFNLGETYFLEGKPEEALKYFEALRENYRDNELLNFKLIVLFHATGRGEDAARLLKRMPYPGEGPAWYYAQAVSAAVAGNKAEAKKYRNTALSLLGEKKCELYEETIQESGLIK